ncbi:hypothetical protein OFC08_29850, partial [Escherichia coli]|nr:hypothetical protein [Escherichia coli]
HVRDAALKFGGGLVCNSYKLLIRSRFQDFFICGELSGKLSHKNGGSGKCRQKQRLDAEYFDEAVREFDLQAFGQIDRTGPARD